MSEKEFSPDDVRFMERALELVDDSAGVLAEPGVNAVVDTALSRRLLSLLRLHLMLRWPLV